MRTDVYNKDMIAQQIAPQESPLMLLSEAARLLRIHPRTLARWADEGLATLVVLPKGGLRITETELARLMSGAVTTEGVQDE